MPLARATAALLGALLLAGCGGGEPTAQLRDEIVRITLDDFFIAPQNIAVEQPVGKVTFAVSNRGRLRHSFRLWGPDSAPLEIETVLPGRRVVQSVYLPAGEYRMVCTVSNHAELGMTGRLVMR
jgi:hypothetical protein